jgi:nucleoside-diphosphate-sugar epimerase
LHDGINSNLTGRNGLSDFLTNRRHNLMKVVVTGGSGQIGRYVVRELVEAGHAVTNVDIVRPAVSICPSRQVDLTQAGEVYGALAGAEAVVHLGAWPNPGLVVDTKTYADNVQGSFNIFQACADLGIKRVVSASSAQVYGFAGAPPQYAPVDETHPLRPINCYALSKTAGEQAADYFVANYGLTILSFRFMGVRVPAAIGPEIERMAQDPGKGAWLLWTRTDARDAAVACRLAVEVETVESGPYNITGARVVLSESSAALVERYFGDKTEIRNGLSEYQSPLSCAKAEQAFGYRPSYLWTEQDQHPEQAG